MLVAEWRGTAKLLEECGASEQAKAFRKVAGELESASRQHVLQELTLEQAVSESGYTYSSLEKRLRSGELPNVGTKGKPRIRRGDLPTKGGRMTQVDGLADEILQKRARCA